MFPGDSLGQGKRIGLYTFKRQLKCTISASGFTHMWASCTDAIFALKLTKDYLNITGSCVHAVALDL